MTQEQLQKIAEDGKLFEKFGTDSLFGTSDGQVFKEKQRATEFATNEKKPLKVYELENPDAEKEAPATSADAGSEEEKTGTDSQSGLSDPNAEKEAPATSADAGSEEEKTGTDSQSGLSNPNA